MHLNFQSVDEQGHTCAVQYHEAVSLLGDGHAIQATIVHDEGEVFLYRGDGTLRVKQDEHAHNGYDLWIPEENQIHRWHGTVLEKAGAARFTAKTPEEALRFLTNFVNLVNRALRDRESL
jgi:hypothetical protein